MVSSVVCETISEVMTLQSNNNEYITVVISIKPLLLKVIQAGIPETTINT